MRTMLHMKVYIFFIFSANCGDPPAPMDGMVTTPTGTTEGNVALYNCFMGFVLNGQSIRICLSSGVWGGVEPTCDPIGNNN